MPCGERVAGPGSERTRGFGRGGRPENAANSTPTTRFAASCSAPRASPAAAGLGPCTAAATCVAPSSRRAEPLERVSVPRRTPAHGHSHSHEAEIACLVVPAAKPVCCKRTCCQIRFQGRGLRWLTARARRAAARRTKQPLRNKGCATGAQPASVTTPQQATLRRTEVAAQLLRLSAVRAGAIGRHDRRRLLGLLRRHHAQLCPGICGKAAL